MKKAIGKISHSLTQSSHSLFPMVDWIYKFDDPNDHLLVHSRILLATARLQYEDCLLQRRFLRISLGPIENESKILSLIDNLKVESESTRSRAIAPSSARRAALSIIKNTHAFVQKYFVSDLGYLTGSEREILLQSLLGFRHSLMLQSADCFDITMPIISELDPLIISLMEGENCSSALGPIDVLRKHAIKACITRSSVPLQPSLLSQLVQLQYPKKDDTCSSEFQGNQDENEEESKIEMEFFTVREHGLPLDPTILMARLIHICAQPDLSLEKSLQIEHAYHRSFFSPDDAIDIDSVFEYLQKANNPTRPNFYKDPNPSAIAQSCGPLQILLDRLMVLLLEFPGHDVLENLKMQAERFLLTPVYCTPLASATVALERLLQKANDWEQYSSKQFSIQEQLAGITSLVVSMRREELETWRLIFNQVQTEYKNRTTSSLIFLIQLLAVNVVSKNMYGEVVKVIEEFLMTGQLGQFAFKLDLIRDLAWIVSDDSLRSLLLATWHYFNPFVEHINILINNHRSQLESDLISFLKTVNWTFSTYWAMRSGVERSHRKMAQFIRKIRELLDRPVSSVLASNPYTPKLDLLSDRISTSPLDSICDDMESRTQTLQTSDDTAQKQRALVDFLSVLKSLGCRLSNKGDFEKCSDTKLMIIASAESRPDLRIFINCLHRFTALYATAISHPHPDLGVRVIDSFQAASGQLIRWMMVMLNQSVLDHFEWVIEESLSRVSNSKDPNCIIPFESIQSVLYDDDINSDDFNRMRRAKTSVMIRKATHQVWTSSDEYISANEFTNGLQNFYDEFTSLMTSDIDGFFKRTALLFEVLSSCLTVSDHHLLSGTKSELKKARKVLSSVIHLKRQFDRSLHKFTFACLSTMNSLLRDGFCHKIQEESDTENKEDNEELNGIGMAEGQGKENVNDQMEFEEQLTGQQGDNNDGGSKPDKEEKEIEMQQDFNAELEKLMIDEDEDKDDEEMDQDDFDDQEADEIDPTAETKEMDSNWSDKEDQSEISSCENELENSTRNKDLVAGEYNDEGSDRNEKENNDNNQDEMECDDSIADPVEHEMEDINTEDGHVENVNEYDSEVDQSDSSNCSESENPNPEKEWPNESVLDAEENSYENATDEMSNSRRLDAEGADSYETGNVESNVINQEDIERSNVQATDQQSTARTIHEIRMKSTRTEQVSNLVGSLERQQFEYADTGQVVTGRSESSRRHHADSFCDDATTRDSLVDSCHDIPPNGQVEMSQLSQHTLTKNDNAANSKKIFEPEDDQVCIDDNMVQYLSYGLCEKLRLVLEPTERTKMQGDYKSGKRLNLRRIIPFIASDYRRDKIWMRRSKPAKRDYKITLCLDQSRSMLEGKANELALTTISSLYLGLEKLEAGSVDLVGFGESIRTHEKSSLSNIPFTDDSSNFGQLLEYLLSSDSPSSNHHWRLCIIITDGICQEHERLRVLVNQCLAQRVLPLLIILDAQKKVSELSHVEYENGKVCFTKYLDTIPFEHYIIVHNISLLPDLLADALQQWFQSQNN